MGESVSCVWLLCCCGGRAIWAMGGNAGVGCLDSRRGDDYGAGGERRVVGEKRV